MSSSSVALQEKLENWFSHADKAEKVAGALLVACKGDARRLLTGHKDPKGVYGEASKILFQGVNEEIHRHLLRTVWTTNKHNVREIFAKKAGGGKKKCRVKQIVATEDSNANCWCKSIPKKGDPTSIPCTQCEKRYHLICSGLTQEQALGIQNFICPKCSGTINIPPIFRTPKVLKGGRDDEGIEFSDGLLRASSTRNLAHMLKNTLTRKSPEKSPHNPRPFTLGSLFRKTHLEAAKETVQSQGLKEGEVLGSDANHQFSADVVERIAVTSQGSTESDFELQDLPEVSAAALLTASQDTLSSAASQHSDEGNLDIPEVHRSKNPSESSSDSSVQFISEVPRENVAVETRSVKTEASTEDLPIATDSNLEVHSNAREYLDTSTQPTKFSLILRNDKWKQVIKHQTLKLDTHDVPWYAQRSEDYGDALQEEFSKRNKCCVLRFKKVAIRQPSEENRAFCRIYSECKGKECGARYAWTIRKVTPPEADYVEVDVNKTTKDELRHYKGEGLHRPISGETRKQYKKELRNKYPSKFLKERYAVADEEQLQLGNLNTVATLKQLQHIRHQALKEGDYHDDLLVDLILTQKRQMEEFGSKALPGFIQNFSIDPFWITLYYQQQLELLRRITRTRRITIFFDSTGSICQKLPVPLTQKQIQYYALVVKSPCSGDPSVPILEFYTTKHDVPGISFHVGDFFHTYSRHYKISGTNYGIGRLETDFSKAMLATCCLTFQHGSVEDYLIVLYDALSNNRKLGEHVVAIHVCRYHVISFWREKVEDTIEIDKKKIAGASKNTKNTPVPQYIVKKEEYLLMWINRFVTAATFHELLYRIYEIMLLLGSQFTSNEVDAVLQNFGGAPDDSIDWEALSMEVSSARDPFYKRSPFGVIAQTILQGIEEDNRRNRERTLSGSMSLEPNDFANNALLSYLLIHVFPYAPMITHCIFTAHGLVIEDDTNNRAESWFKEIKKNCFTDPSLGSGGIRAPRLAREHAVLTPGCVKRALASLGPNKEIPADEDTDQQADTESPEKHYSQWGPKQKRADNIHRVSSGINMPLIPLGGKVRLGKDIITITKTCNIDCTLQILFYLDRYTTKGREFFAGKTDQLAETVRKIFDLIENDKGNSARLLWIQEVIRVPLKKDMEGEERQRGVGGIEAWLQYIKKTYKCQQPGCPLNSRGPVIVSPVAEHPLSPEMFQSWFKNGLDVNCEVCHGRGASVAYAFNGEPPTLLVYTCDSRWESSLTGVTVHAYERDLKRKQVIGNVAYTVQAYTLYTGDHFFAVFWTNEGRFTYNGAEFPLRIAPRTAMEDLAVHTIWALRD